MYNDLQPEIKIKRSGANEYKKLILISFMIKKVYPK